MNSFTGESVGTMVLLVLSIGIGADSDLKGSVAKGVSWRHIIMAWGLVITFAAYVAGGLDSKAHLDPAVTLSFAAFGLFPRKDVLPYITAQFLGAFAGAATITTHYYPHFEATKNENEGNHIGTFTTGAAIDNLISNFLSEVIATFILVLTPLNLGDFTTGLKPLILGLLIMVVGQAFGETTGFTLDPVRDWGPRFAYIVLPTPNKGSAHWSYAWIPMFGPLVGAFIATGLQTLVLSMMK